jgi:hypothetical protein
VRIAPNYAVSLGYLGEARRLNDDRPGAKEAFQRALALEADYVFGGFQLFDMQLEDGELAGARATLQTLEQHISDHNITLARLELAAKENDVEVAAQSFRALCRATTAGCGTFDHAIKILADKLWGEQIDAVLNEAVEGSDTNALVGALWVERWFDRDDAQKYRARLEAWPNKNAVWHSAATAYLENLTQTRRGSEARQFIAKCADGLRQEANSWGIVGYVLLELHQEKQAAEWLSDWPTRASVAPWMLWNGALALRSLQRDDEAHQWGQHALKLPSDHCTDAHHVLIAFDEVLAGQTEAGAERLRGVTYDQLSEWQMFTYNTTEQMIEFYRARAQRRGALWQRLFELGRMRRRRPSFWLDEVLYRLHQRATRAIARDAENIGDKALAQLFVVGMYLKRSFLRSQS